MFKKEFRDTLRILLESSLLMLSIPLTLGLALLLGLYIPVADFIKAVSIITIFVFAGYSGLAIFQTERRDKGFEYLLTLPVSKLKIFLAKIVPRFVVLSVLAGIALLFLDITFEEVVIPLIFLQIGGVFLSLAFNSFFLGVISVALLGFIYSLLYMFLNNFYYYLRQFDLDLFSIIPPGIPTVLLLGIPLGISFFLVYRNFDIKPYKYTIKPYFFIAIPLLLLQVLIVVVYFDSVRFV